MNTGMMRRKRLTALIFCLSALMFANAQKVTIDGLNYYLNADNHEAIVDNGNSWSGELVIPSEVSHNGEKYVVKSLGAFSGCKSLKSVSLSESIRHIAAYTFYKCESLEFLEIPESVSSFGESVFRWSPIKTLVIRGTFPQGFRYDTFYFMDAEVVIYVQDTEVEKLKAELAKIKDFSGKVLPLSSYDALSVYSVCGKQNDDMILYDLQGRRLNAKPRKGIYIQNGQKVAGG